MDLLNRLWDVRWIRITWYIACRFAFILVMAMFLELVFGPVTGMSKADASFFDNTLSGWYMLMMLGYAASSILDAAKDDAG